MSRLPTTPQTTPPLSDTVAPVEAAVDALVSEMTVAWKRGGRLRAEELLRSHAWLAADPQAALRLVHEEYCLAREFGEEPLVDDLVRRFPQWQEPLRVMLAAEELLGLGPAPPRYPAPGEQLEDFTIEAELGRGAVGRVFLARQCSLANRLLVLKLTPRDGHEHLSLARLQHTHIAPLYWTRELPERNLRVLCLPFLGSVTLARVLDELAVIPPARRSGLDVRHVLDCATVGKVTAVPASGPDGTRLAALPYVSAICWLGACLAEALSYAHQRGLVHLDIKPSNVLLTSDGQPLILDFHLARRPIEGGETAVDHLGGTPGYMAPEHQAALDAVSRGQPVPQAVDGRADQYGLGLVLYELLAGRRGADATAEPERLPLVDPHISPGLTDILTRCLAPAPEDRYPDAGALAVDLRRHLEDQPLLGVPNRSWRERWRKWRRRRPYELAIVLALLVALGGVLGGAVLATGWFVNRWQAAEHALTQGRELLDRNDFANAAVVLTAGQERATGLPGAGTLLASLEAHRQAAARGGKLTALHEFAELLRFHAALEPPPPRLRLFVDGSRKHWQEREELLRRRGSPLKEALEQGLRTDLLDLAVVSADLQARLAQPAARPDAHRAALARLREAETLFGPGVVVLRHQWVHARALGDQALTRQLDERLLNQQPATPWEHYAVGRFWLLHGDLGQAVPALERAAEVDPLGFFPHFYLGIALDRRGDYARAVAEFTFCAGREPRWECLFHRGRSHAAAGELNLALKDFNLALQLDPTSGVAALHRAMLQRRRGQLDAALADLRFALKNNAPPAEVHCARARLELDHHDPAAARRAIEQALEHDPQHAEALALQQQLAMRP